MPWGPLGAPGAVTGFVGVRELGLDNEFRPTGERAVFWPLGRFVLSLGSDGDVGRSRASGGDLAGKLMTCSRKGTE